MREWLYPPIVAAILELCVTLPAHVDMECVAVGNPGNAGELSGVGAGGMGPDRVCGAVKYEFEMGRFEVTAAQYTAFLNAVAPTDTYGLYNPQMAAHAEGCRIRRTGDAGSYKYTVAAEWAQRPVNFVSWGDAARFANWLHNGQPAGSQDATSTEDGSYQLNGANDNAALSRIKRRPKATWVIPTEDEWYKAAFHKNDGVTGNYWDYATGADTIPSNERRAPDPGNTANFAVNEHDHTLGSPYWRTPVGAFENSKSPYGTFDQDGNVWEWIEAVHRQQGQTRRGVRGASYFTQAQHLRASDRHFGLEPATEHQLVGFRVGRLAARDTTTTPAEQRMAHVWWNAGAVRILAQRPGGLAEGPARALVVVRPPWIRVLAAQPVGGDPRRADRAAARCGNAARRGTMAAAVARCSGVQRGRAVGGRPQVTPG